MTLHEYIAYLQEQEKLHGPNIQVFSSHIMEDVLLRVDSGKDYDDSWNMPDKFLILGDSN